MTTLSAPPSAYRADIDGLRAVAIASVVVFHAFPTVLPGGFVGVDVFFVISGFLISNIIFTDLRKDRFSFRSFYARRICRIFPALVLVLAAVLAAGWFILLTDEYQLLGKHVRGGALYVSNFILRKEAGYFDVAAESKPLLHLWSLAIEEQFYIIWPLAAVLAFRRRLDLFNVVAFLLLASFVYNVVRVTQNPVATFYLPGTRMWELLIGVALAHFQHFGWTGVGRRLEALRLDLSAGVRAALGLAAIAAPTVLLDKDSIFPGWWAAAPTVGTALLISAGPSAWVNRTLLANPLMVFIGLISYPLYLWHWPLLSLARIVEGEELPWPDRLGLVALSVLLAFLTYRLIERPVRFGSMARMRAATILAALCVGVGIAGHAADTTAIRPYASRFGVDRILAAVGEWEHPGDMEKLPFDDRKVWRKAGSGGAVLFVGDSNVEQYSPRVRALLAAAPQSYKTALFLTGGGCPPIPAVSEAGHPHCDGLVDAAAKVADKYDVDTVVLAAQWWGYFASTAYRVGPRPLVEPEAARAALDSLAATIRRFAAGGRQVFVILNIPIGSELDPKGQVERTFLSFRVKEAGIPLARLQEKYGDTSRLIAAVAAEAGATVVDPLPHLCNADGQCPATTPEGDAIYMDAAHLRASYVRRQVDYLDVALRNGR